MYIITRTDRNGKTEKAAGDAPWPPILTESFVIVLFRDGLFTGRSRVRRGYDDLLDLIKSWK